MKRSIDAIRNYAELSRLSNVPTVITNVLAGAALGRWKEVKHFEVETYAWNVLPKELQKDDLAEGIADELIWLRERMHPSTE